MAEATQATEAPAETLGKGAKATKEAKEAKYTLTHKGFGKYAVEGTGKVFDTKALAEAYVVELEKAARYADQFGDILPEGFEVRERTLEIRGSLTELPMNEVYLPSGETNPYYDRAWAWGWGRATGNDIASKQARGYRVVNREELEEAVKDGKVPDHYLNLLMPVDTGTRMQYGDLVLMRIPRVLWRQHHAAQEESAKRRIKMTDESNHAAFDQAGVKNLSGPISNEVSSGLKMSGF